MLHLLEKTSYVAFSIFYSNTYRKRLLSNCLLDVFKTLETSFCCSDIIVMLSFERGENIRILIPTQTENQFKVELYCKKYIKNWLKRNPSRYMESTENLGKCFWMNYNNNSVHFNLFSAPGALLQRTDEQLLLNNLIYQQVLYFLLGKNDSNAAESEEEDKVTTLISFYLATFSQISRRNAAACLNNLLSLNSYQLSSNKADNIASVTKEDVANDFLENKEYILEFYDRLQNHLVPELINWMNFCENKFTNFTTDELLQEFVINILKQINLYFGLNPVEENYLFFFVEHFLFCIE